MTPNNLWLFLCVAGLANNVLDVVVHAALEDDRLAYRFEDGASYCSLCRSLLLIQIYEHERLVFLTRSKPGCLRATRIIKFLMSLASCKLVE